MYFLEKALLSGSLDKQLFLKVGAFFFFFFLFDLVWMPQTYRSTSREQFIKRATMKKVHEVQRAMKAEQAK